MKQGNKKKNNQNKKKEIKGKIGMDSQFNRTIWCQLLWAMTKSILVKLKIPQKNVN